MIHKTLNKECNEASNDSLHRSLQENLYKDSHEELQQPESPRQELSVRSDDSLGGADSPTATATQEADNSQATNTSTTNEGVVSSSANNTGGFNRPVRCRAPSIRHGDACCHQTHGLQLLGAENKNSDTTHFVNFAN